MDEVLSKVFALLRYPLALLVVYLHIDSCPVSFEAIFDVEEPAFYLIKIMVVISAQLAVPCFFIISGYLFFVKHKTFSKEDYLYVIQKKGRTLLIPYIVWNLLAVAYLKITQDIILISFYDIFISPANFPLWFLRNLIVLFLTYPLILAVFKMKWLGLILLFLIFYVPAQFNLLHPYTYKSLFFFAIGGFCAVYANDIMGRMNGLKKGLYSMTLILYFLYVFTLGNESVLLSNSYLIFGCASLFLFAYNNVKKGRLSFYPLLGEASFFIYLSHKVGFTAFAKRMFFWLPQNELGHIFNFLLAPVLVTLLCVCIYMLIFKKLERFLGWTIGK